MDNSQIENTITEIRKRSGTVTVFNQDKISNAIFQALKATSKADRGVADKLATDVVDSQIDQELSIEYNSTKKYGNSKRQNHTIGKWYLDENNHQKNNLGLS